MSRTFSVELTQDQIEQFLQLAKTLKNTFGELVPTEYKEKTKLIKFFSRVKSYDDMLSQGTSKKDCIISQSVFNTFAEFFFRKCALTDFVYAGKAGENNIGSSIDADIRNEKGEQVLVYCHSAFRQHPGYVRRVADATTVQSKVFEEYLMMNHCISERAIGELLFNAQANSILTTNTVIFTPMKEKEIMVSPNLGGVESNFVTFAREKQLEILKNYPTFWEDLTSDLIEKL